ncbi:enoyl-CoA hydratase/isomerase family protein [Undibacterium crateris]|uniref:enoyl-CoA hydratase/isomerase family protein n=1 Tax=Undibacterium crateris TaxID=2528175 RepID=UPI001389931C|nr:enoyl-CoA hydratase/isomerase family protein [Undibacterium crateris]NDI85584.1 enoyl-CoA hydratase/isomerase family protein [Undibacterium crateris]
MIDLIEHGSEIIELRISRPPLNLIDVTVLKALRSALAEAEHAGFRGVMLSGVPGMFSSGVDIASLIDADRATVRAYWEQVFLLAIDMARSRLPIFAAISGHCLAAGALLAVFCDYRLMARGGWRIGLNEVQVGVALPACFQYAVRRVVGALNAERLLVFGRLLEPAQALEMGLVDELVHPANLITSTRERLQELLLMPAHGFTETRAIARRDLCEVFADMDALPLDEFVDAFMLPETQSVLRRVVSQMRRTTLNVTSV